MEDDADEKIMKSLKKKTDKKIKEKKEIITNITKGKEMNIEKVMKLIKILQLKVKVLEQNNKKRERKQ